MRALSSSSPVTSPWRSTTSTQHTAHGTLTHCAALATRSPVRRRPVAVAVAAAVVQAGSIWAHECCASKAQHTRWTSSAAGRCWTSPRSSACRRGTGRSCPTGCSCRSACSCSVRCCCSACTRLGTPRWAVWANVGAQLCSHLLTAALRGPWQGQPADDPLGADSPFLADIARTHADQDAAHQRQRRCVAPLDVPLHASRPAARCDQPDTASSPGRHHVELSTLNDQQKPLVPLLQDQSTSSTQPRGAECGGVAGRGTAGWLQELAEGS